MPPIFRPSTTPVTGLSFCHKACHFCIYSVKINLEDRFVTNFMVFLFEIVFARGIFLNASVLYCIDPAKLHTCDLQFLKIFTYYFRFPSKVCSKKVSHVETTTKWRYGCEIFWFFLLSFSQNERKIY